MGNDKGLKRGPMPPVDGAADGSDPVLS